MYMAASRRERMSSTDQNGTRSDAKHRPDPKYPAYQEAALQPDPKRDQIIIKNKQD
jgi:hypothetical protein